MKLNHKDFILGDILYNNRCHLNSVQKVKMGKASKIYLCYVIDKDNEHSMVHFINQLENGKYQDNTLGWIYQTYNYYVIKEVNETEYDTIWNVLTNTKEDLLAHNSNWFDRNILKITKEII
jgi:hypothetical protein